MLTLLQRNCKRTKIELSAVSAALGHVAVSLGGHRAHVEAADRFLHRQWRCRGRRNQRYVICNVTVLRTKTQNWRVSLECEFLHVITQIVTFRTKRITPYFKSMSVTSVFDSKFSARSSEREHCILAASRSAKRALLHRERRVQIL